MKLKAKVVIEHKKKLYRREIPDDIFSEIYGNDSEKYRKKYEFVETSSEEKEISE
jgi:hypothetical protein